MWLRRQDNLGITKYMLCLGCNCEAGGQSETTAGVQEVTIKVRAAAVCGGRGLPVNGCSLYKGPAGRG